MPGGGGVDREWSGYPVQPRGARSQLTTTSLDQPWADANRAWRVSVSRRGSAPALARRSFVTAWLLVAITGCTNGAGESAAKLTYPDLRTVPARPVPEDTLAEREAIGDELLRTREEQTYSREELRYRVGLRPSPPVPASQYPSLSEPEAPEEMRRPPPSAGLEARFLRQQIEGEANDDSLNDFLGKVAERPVDIEPLAAGEVFVPEDRGMRSRLFSDTPETEEAPEYPDWRGYRPLLDRLFGLGADRPS